MKKTVFCLVIFFIFNVLCIFPKNFQPVVLNSAHVRTITSKVVEGMEYELFIAIPPGYDENSKKTFPVVYMLDAYEVFGLQLQTYQQLIFFKTVPPMILVGINYKIKNKSFYDGLKDYFYIRSRDFTPTHLTLQQIIEKHGKGFANYVPVSGGGEKFLRFLKEELFPFIESEYRADKNDRGILGYSLGGLFTTYVLFYDPSVFKKVFIGSPALWWDDKVIFSFYDEKKLNDLSEPIKVYLSVGELEGKGLQNSWEDLKNFLEKKNHAKIQLITERLPGEYHLTGIGLAHSRAFRRLYEKK